MIQRQQILRGPAIGSFNSVSFYTESDITVTITSKTQPVEVAMFGQIDESDDDVMIEVAFTPSGEITTALLALFLPFFQSTYYPGTPLFGATDKPLVLTTRNGEQLTIMSAALTTPAPISAVGTKKFFGAVKFTGLPVNGSSWSTANRLFTSALGGTYPGDAGFVPANIIRQPFLGKWFSGTLPSGTATVTETSPAVFSDTSDGLAIGDTIVNSGYTNSALNGTFTVATTPTSGTYTLYQFGTTTPVNNTIAADTGTFTRANLGDSFFSFDTEAGFSITPQVSLTPDKTDNGGTINMIFQKATVTAKAIPVGPGVADLLSLIGLQGTGAVRGRSLASRALPLYLTGAGLYAKLPLAALTTENIRYGVNPKRLGELQWNSEMSFASNVPVPLLEVSTSPIS